MGIPIPIPLFVAPAPATRGGPATRQLCATPGSYIRCSSSTSPVSFTPPSVWPSGCAAHTLLGALVRLLASKGSFLLTMVAGILSTTTWASSGAEVQQGGRMATRSPHLDLSERD